MMYRMFDPPSPVSGRMGTMLLGDDRGSPYRITAEVWWSLRLLSLPKDDPGGGYTFVVDVPAYTEP